MCEMTGFDVYYAKDKISIEPHFCRSHEDCGGGRPFKEAVKEVADFFRRYADQVEEMTDYDQYRMESSP